MRVLGRGFVPAACVSCMACIAPAAADQGNRSPRSASGDEPPCLLTPDTCLVAVIDLQSQMLFGVASHDLRFWF
jgi:hypothetical protein